MKKTFGKFLVVLLALFSLAAYSDTQTNQDRSSDTLQFDRLPDRDRGPAFSSPPLTVTPDGDIASPYPPYHRPDQPRM